MRRYAPFVKKENFFSEVPLMLKHWMTHAEYQQFISVSITHLNESQLKKLRSYQYSLDKLTSLNLDPVGDYLAPFYSHTGRPALNQPQIIRSLVLMLDQKIQSLDKWVKNLHNDDILALLIGCSTDSLPPLGSYYDFIDRLWLQSENSEKLGRNILLPACKNSKPSQKPGKGKKLPNRHSNVVKQVADYVSSDHKIPFHFEETLQKIFMIAAVVPSMELGLIDKNDLTISGDGTCVHTHANPYGHRKCNCGKKGIFDCKCPRHYSDPDASYGWDSDLGSYYFGYTLYTLSYHSSKYKTDLPILLRFLDARRHDSVSGIVTLAELRNLAPDFKIKNLCFDSANDNYATYELLKKWNINPFIDLNSNRGRPSAIPDNITIDTDGTPLCSAGYRMINWGYCSQKHSRKWRCPVACGRKNSCSCKESCSTSAYGRCVYTKPDWDIRLYTPIPRGTTKYKQIYNNRTGSERVNNRILNDYHLHDMKIHGRKRYSFFTMIAGINIHLDARIKIQTSVA